MIEGDAASTAPAEAHIIVTTRSSPRMNPPLRNHEVEHRRVGARFGSEVRVTSEKGEIPNPSLD
jgi:hypothetical protein